MKKNFNIFIVLFFFVFTGFAQDWTLELSSSVELRTLKLTNKAEKNDRPLGGASIVLYQGSTIVKQVSSDANGDFTLEVPSNGEYMLVVSYKDCNPKKFQVSTKGVPENIAKDNFRPSFNIGGAIMAKPLYSIDYSILKQPMAKISFMMDRKKIDHDDSYTDQILSSLSKMKQAEDDLVEKFLEAVNAGDKALKKPDCPLAKKMYEQALALIPNEQYPTEQLVKVGLCLKDKEAAAAKEKEAADKALADKAAKEKEAADKLAKEKEAADKAAADKAALAKAAADKALADKAAADKAAKEKETADKLAKEKEAADKAAADKAAADKALADKAEKDKAAKEKEAADKLAKEKEAADKAVADKAAADKALADKAKKEKAAADKALADKAKNEKAANEKAEADRLAKEKNEADKLQKELLAKEKLESEKIAREKAAADKAASEKQSKDKENTIVPNQGAAQNSEDPTVKSKETKYKIPQVLGANKYKEIIKRADDYFKTKRYEEAKVAYQDALKNKPDDIYATNKLADIEKILSTK